jgi:hypothetical protein
VPPATCSCGVGQSDQADIGYQAQLQLQPAFLASLALLGVVRGSMSGRREVDIAQPATSAAPDKQPLAGHDQIANQISGARVRHDRSRRDEQIEVMTGLAVLL